MMESDYIGGSKSALTDLFQSYIREYEVINQDIITNIQQLTDAFTTGIEEYKVDCGTIQGLINATNNNLRTAAAGIQENWHGNQKNKFDEESEDLSNAIDKLATAFADFSAAFEQIRGKLESVNNELNSAVKTAGECTGALADDVKTFKENLGIIDA